MVTIDYMRVPGDTRTAIKLHKNFKVIEVIANQKLDSSFF